MKLYEIIGMLMFMHGISFTIVGFCLIIGGGIKP